MRRPVLLPVNLSDETYAGVTYHMGGALVPALTIDLDGGETVYFEHHVLLWKSAPIKIGVRKMKGLMKRMIMGMQIFVTEARGTGQVAFSRDGPGHICPIHLQPGQAIDVREHQFLAATGSVSYDFFRVRGVANILGGQSGYFIDRFRAERSEGIVWLHGYGNVFEKVLAPGEMIDIEPGAWLYKDPELKMTTRIMGLTAGLFGGSSMIINRFTGPGRVGIQSMSVTIPDKNPGSK
jgi:uncharacterized protein (AIM24 family)